MKESIALFDLIKTLTKSEKRYIKLFFKLQEGDKKYEQLFDAIHKQNEYDERKIKEQ